MLLLSDGVENGSPTADQVLSGIIADKITVHTLALGIGADKEKLENIANQTGGVYRYNLANGMTDIFYAIYSKVYGESVVKRVSGTVLPNSTVEQSVTVDSTIGSMNFSINWPGSDLDLTLVRPNGTVVNPTVAENDPDIAFVSGLTYEFYTVYAPQPGIWTMRIFGKSTDPSGEDFIASVSAMDSMIVSVDVDKTDYFTGDSIKLTASVEDGSLVDPLDTDYVHGLTVQVTVIDPGTNTFAFELYDDGLHGDGNPDDGIYANTFGNTGSVGSYNFTVQISGSNIRYSQPFTREYSLSTTVAERVFPSTPVLDDFNRVNGSIGNNWSGRTSAFAISSNALDVTYNTSDADIYWSSEPFGADQEAYVTLTDVDTNAWEQNLLLKSQSNNTWGDGVLEVWYDAQNQRVQVWTWEWPAEWVQHGADIPVTFVDGDTFGARALADGTVEVYRNGELLATRDIASWSHYADGGYVGLWFIGAEDAVLEDFGGGTISSGMQSMSVGGTLESQGVETSLTPEQSNVTLNDTHLFWQGVPIGSSQKAYVTFAQLDKDFSTLAKPQSNGVWGEGIVQVLYDVAGGRIQVWMYDPHKGWMQYGEDIPVQFAEGDTFSARVLANGMVEIQRNGKPLAKRDVTP